jgi:general secretion pathway protein A
MYASFFGLKHEPFSIAPDPRYLYMSKRHREALAHLLYGVKGGGGFVLLSGEIGAGKTTVCRCFLEQIPKRTNVGYIFNPKLTVPELLQSICDEFRLDLPTHAGREPTVKEYVDALNDFLLKTHAVGQNNVLIIDEAQMLSAEVLEQLRLLTNLETNERKLLQIVLIGQPELRTMLAQPELEQLAQRVIARFHLKALSAAETQQYIRHRLAVAGLTRGMPFDREAMERIHVLSRGIPRRINLLCDRAMLGAYAKGTHRIGRDVVARAAAEVFGRSEPATRPAQQPQRTWLLGVGLAAVAAIAVWVGWLLAADRYGRPAAVAATSAVPGSAAASGSAMSPGPASATLASRGGVAPGGSGATSGAAATAPPHLASASAAPAPRASAASGAAAPASSATVAAASAAAARAAPATAPSATAVVARTAALDGTATLEAPHDLAAADLKGAWASDRDAWRALGPLWSLDLAGGEPCEVAQGHQARCFKGASSIEFVRKLGRPGIVSLRDDAGRRVHVLLVGLVDQAALLQTAEGQRNVTLASFAKAWPGDFATLWRVPPGYAGPVGEGDTGQTVDYLAAQLARLAGEPPPVGKQTMDAALKKKVARFQSTHGIRAAGTAGPTTFMQLNRATGVEEPWLRLQLP